MKSSKCLIHALALIAIAGVVGNAAEADSTHYPEATLAGTQVRTLHSDVVDEDYRLLIYRPPGYTKSDAAYPVLYLTDGASFFGFVRAVVTSIQFARDIPPMMIVGIAYKESGAVAWSNRARDHLPAVSDDIPAAGGAEKFVGFFESELIPFVESNYKADSADRIFAGMSSGGTLGAYILVTRPTLFHRYLIVSPALHSGNEMIIGLESQYAQSHEDLAAVAYTAMGELEPELQYKHWDILVDSLASRDYKGLRLTHEIIDGGTHMDAVYSAYVRGLKAVYSDYTRDGN